MKRPFIFCLSIFLLITTCIQPAYSQSMLGALSKAVKKKSDPNNPGQNSGLPDAQLSATEAKYAGKIIFSPDPITGTSIDDSKTKTTFKLGDPIYGRIILPNLLGKLKNLNKKQVADFKSETATPNIFITIDGDKTLLQKFEYVSLKDMHVDSYAGDLVLMESSSKVPAEMKKINDWLTQKLQVLAAGTHTVHVEIYFNVLSDESRYGTPKKMAESDFSVTVDDNPVHTGHTWAEYKSYNADAETMDNIKTIAKTRWPDENIIDVKCGPWSINKDSYNIPTSRSAYFHVYIKRGKKCFAREVPYEQEYAGGGTYNTNGSIDNHEKITDKLLDCQ